MLLRLRTTRDILGIGGYLFRHDEPTGRDVFGHGPDPLDLHFDADWIAFTAPSHTRSDIEWMYRRLFQSLAVPADYLRQK